jgi:hypothetical protein
VSADVERTPDATSSSENLTQTSRSRRPKIVNLGRHQYQRGVDAVSRTSCRAHVKHITWRSTVASDLRKRWSAQR